MTDELYDVFAQTGPAQDLVHVGSVRAPGDPAGGSIRSRSEPLLL